MNAVTVNSNRSTLGRAAALAACLLAGTLGVAQAAPAPSDVPTVVVSYNDLDLASAAGVSTLYKRISLAARDVCPSEGVMQLTQVAHARACRQAAIERAVAQVHNSQLAALSAEHAKRG
jgi:UrcA family protein